MLRINQQTNAAAAKSYYSSPAEYYRPGEQEIVGQWGGKAADRLDLAGDVLRPHFERLCDNLHPFTAEQLTARMRKDRRVGYDFTFDAPKSVSILYGLIDDPAILGAFRWAIRETMGEMEAGVKTRVRKRGQFAERIVGNMAWAEFIHFTARPVKGKTDPHLHGHAFVPNVCWDHVEHAWKAIDVASIKEDGSYWQAQFQERFGQRLAELGYDIVWKGDNFEIAGIDRGLIDRFSLRTHQINQAAEKRGVTDAKDKDRLGALTRESKRKDQTMPQLRAEWRQRLTDADRVALAQAALRQRHPAGDRRDSPPAHRQTRQPAPGGSGPAMIARLRARAKAARPELDAWEQQRRDWIRQQPMRREAAGNDQTPRNAPGRTR
ncbi:MobF family relaxase [Singulisphaera sp. PoT]|uniref:MobF family relaxase n=1 Tax=Singulisphaera sp. PoT TaxID=3411797 RepID=UPI003BF5A05E